MAGFIPMSSPQRASQPSSPTPPSAHNSNTHRPLRRSACTRSPVPDDLPNFTARRPVPQCSNPQISSWGSYCVASMPCSVRTTPSAHHAPPYSHTSRHASVSRSTRAPCRHPIMPASTPAPIGPTIIGTTDNSNSTRRRHTGQTVCLWSGLQPCGGNMPLDRDGDGQWASSGDRVYVRAVDGRPLAPVVGHVCGAARVLRLWWIGHCPGAMAVGGQSATRCIGPMGEACVRGFL